MDSTHQGLAFILMALGPEDVSRIRTGQLTQHAVAILRLLRDFLSVVFKVREEPENSAITLACLGSGRRNTARQVT